MRSVATRLVRALTRRRVMRHTGKYWNLTVLSAVGCLVASAMVANWSASSHSFHLWLDIVPSGLGGSALITSTLIALISSVDREHVAVATGCEWPTPASVALNGPRVQCHISSAQRARCWASASAAR